MIAINFSFELRKPTPAILSTQKMKERIKIVAASSSLSAIAVLIPKYVVMMDTKSLIETDGESA